MSEVISLCYVIYPMLENIKEGKELADHVHRNLEIIKNRQSEVTKPGYALENGTKKQQEELAAIEKAEQDLHAEARKKYEMIRNGMREELDVQAYVSSSMMNSSAAKDLAAALESGLVVHPYELVMLWRLYKENTACRRMLGRYAASKGWDDVYIGDRYDAVNLVVTEFLGHLESAIESPFDSYGSVWLKTPLSLERYAAEQGVYEEFQINLEEITDNPERYKSAAEDAFLHNVHKRRVFEYKL